MEQKGGTTFGIICQVGEDQNTQPTELNTPSADGSIDFDAALGGETEFGMHGSVDVDNPEDEYAEIIKSDEAQSSPDLDTPIRSKRQTAFQKRVEELAAKRDEAERAYQEELAKLNKRHAVGYIRVSTKGQDADDKYGAEVQRDAILKFCELNNFVIDRWYYDTISGTIESRPEWNKILYDNEVLNPPIEAVIAYKSDRIARDIKLYFYFLFLLEKRGIKLISTKEKFDDDQYGLASVYRALMLFVAEQERRNIALRTGSGRSVKANAGGYAGGQAPYGYSSTRGSGRLVVNEEEAKIVQLVFKLLDSGWTMNDIADELNDRGYRTRNGKHFRFYQIRSLKDNRKTYEGYYKYGKDGHWVKGAHQPILEEIRPLVDTHDIPDDDDEFMHYVYADRLPGDKDIRYR